MVAGGAGTLGCGGSYRPARTATSEAPSGAAGVAECDSLVVS